MYVCLCRAVTSQTIVETVRSGATTTKKVAAACGAGAECGRCRRTVQSIIAAETREAQQGEPTGHRSWWRRRP